MQLIMINANNIAGFSPDAEIQGYIQWRYTYFDYIPFGMNLIPN